MVARKLLDKINDDVDFYQHQVDGVRTMAKMSSFILADEMGLGKANACSELIQTPDGCAPMGAIVVGDYVIGSDGIPTLVTAVHPQGVQPIYRVTFQDGATSRVTLDHLWSVKTNNDITRGTCRVLSTGDMMKVRDGAGNRRFRVPLVAPVRYQRNDHLLVDPYTLGVLLGDGCITQSDVVFFSGQDTPEIESYCRWVSADSSSFRERGHVGVVGGATRKALDQLCLMGRHSWEKFVPVEYLTAPIEDRLALVQGLMDTDGTPIKCGGGTEYSTTSDSLKDGMVQLVRSLGGIAQVHLKTEPQYPYKGEILTGRPAWRVNVKLPIQFDPFRLRRKLDEWIRPTKYEATRLIDSIEYDGDEEAQCITVEADDHLYLANDFIVTHNSLSSLTVSAVDFQRGWAQRVLVVCPSFLKWNWAEELEKLTSYTFTILNGTPKERQAIMDAFDSDILITNYEQVVNDAAMLAQYQWDIMIVDEAHFIKGRTSKRGKAVRGLKAGRKFLLTGSPMLNRPDELWALLNACDPERFNSYWKFTNRFCVMGGWQSKQIVGAKNKDELRGILAEYMIRRLKKDCLDLPDKQIVHVYVELHPMQRKAYDQLDAELKLEIPGDPTPMEAENVLTKMLRLKQIAATPATVGLPDDSYKLDKAMEMIGEFTTDPDSPTPVVLFTQFRGVQAAMAARLDTAGVPYWTLNGSTPKESRIELVNEWASNPQPGVIMVMLQMGVGLNLTAANKAIFVDRLYVPKLNEQAEDRIHRIGADKTKPVQIFNIVAKKTVEERIERILSGKRKLFDSVIEMDSSWKADLIKELANDE